MTRSTRTLCLFLAILLLSTTGCSNLFRSEPPPDLKKAVVLVSANYLRYLVQNNKKQVEDLVFWAEYLDRVSTGGAFTKPQYFLQMDQLANNFSPRDAENHPLLGLDLLDVDYSSNAARVVFQKFGNPNAPQIEIHLAWIGRGWIIVEDSLFGLRGLIPTLARNNSYSGAR